MAPLFSKRLSCFYCGRRSAQADRGPVHKWRCNHCEAINYLDEVWLLSLVFLFLDGVLTILCYRMGKSQTLLPQKRTLPCMALEPQAHPSSQPTSQHPACFVRNAFATSISSRLPSHLTFRQPMIPHMVPMKGNTRSSASIWKSGTRRSASNASRTSESVFARPDTRLNRTI